MQMRSTGIPELACVDDIDYIRTALVLGETDSRAEERFQDVIQQCLDLKWTVQLSWIAHNLKHRKSSWTIINFYDEIPTHYQILLSRVRE